MRGAIPPLPQYAFMACCSLKKAQGQLYLTLHIRGPFAKFVDSPYYSESELCGGAVTVSFSSTSLGKRCTSITLHPLTENVLQTVDH
jgi:hypothetical protein